MIWLKKSALDYIVDFSLSPFHASWWLKKLRSTEMKNGLLKEPRRAPLFPHKEAFKAIFVVVVVLYEDVVLSLSSPKLA